MFVKSLSWISFGKRPILQVAKMPLEGKPTNLKNNTNTWAHMDPPQTLCVSDQTITWSY